MIDLQTQRPLQFNSDEERAAYITALTARLDATENPVTSPTLHADRWGHPTNQES